MNLLEAITSNGRTMILPENDVKMNKIKVGQIYEVVTESFFDTGQHNPTHQVTHIPRGEYIEIRFPYKWHFRTTYGKYYHATASMINTHCKLIGQVYENVKMDNIAKLSDIIRLKLYNQPQKAREK